MDRSFFDVRIFHHGAASNQCSTIEKSFIKHEQEKKRIYNERTLQVEKSTFTPLVFSTSGAMGEEADKLNKRIASLMSSKKGNLYSDCISYIRKKLRFCILRTVLASIRGYRGRTVTKELLDCDINLIENYELCY